MAAERSFLGQQLFHNMTKEIAETTLLTEQKNGYGLFILFYTYGTNYYFVTYNRSTRETKHSQLVIKDGLFEYSNVAPKPNISSDPFSLDYYDEEDNYYYTMSFSKTLDLSNITNFICREYTNKIHDIYIYYPHQNPGSNITKFYSIKELEDIHIIPKHTYHPFLEYNRGIYDYCPNHKTSKKTCRICGKYECCINASIPAPPLPRAISPESPRRPSFSSAINKESSKAAHSNSDIAPEMFGRISESSKAAHSNSYVAPESDNNLKVKKLSDAGIEYLRKTRDVTILRGENISKDRQVIDLERQISDLKRQLLEKDRRISDLEKQLGFKEPGSNKYLKYKQKYLQLKQLI